MKKRGFTLIELLAVILILGIIALIAIPVVNNIINESKMSSFKATVQNVVKAVETKCEVERLNGGELTTTYTFSDSVVTPSLDIKGKIPTKGKVSVDNECNISFKNITNGKYTARKDLNNDAITVVDGIPKVCSVTTGDGTNIGDVITCETESFYVYDTTGDNIKMLAKYNLKVGGTGRHINYSFKATPYLEEEFTYMQDENMKGQTNEEIYYGTTAFSSDVKKGTSYSDYSGSLVEEYVNIYKGILEDLGVNVISANLISLKELKDLGCETWSCTSAPGFITETSYWTNNSYNDTKVWAIGHVGNLTGDSYSDAAIRGVRPVIVIPKSEI